MHNSLPIGKLETGRRQRTICSTNPGATIKAKERLTSPSSSVPMLITAAVVCVLFMLVAGVRVYGNTRRTITAAEWVEHTQEVLTSLRVAAQMTDRVESSAHLYLITADAGRLDQARSSVNILESTTAHLNALVAADAEERSNTAQLTACSAELTQTINAFNTGSALPKGTIQLCQQTIAMMTEQERRLLAERTTSSQRISIESLTTDFLFVGISVLALITLFGFLLRGALLSQRTDRRILKANRDLEKSIQSLKDQANESEMLTTARDELQICVTLQEVYDSAAKGFARLIPHTSGALCMLNPHNMLETVSSWGEDVVLEDCHPTESCCGLRSGQPRWRQPAISEIHCSHFGRRKPEFYVCAPVIAHGETLGLLYVQCQDAAGMELLNPRVLAMRQLLQLTGMAVASMKLRIKLENQSIRDPLTNLFNRHFMEIALERELLRATRKKSVLGVFMVDVDHFKVFNDTHGHAVGDAVLKLVAEVCHKSIRNEDFACRYGGDEFTIILPDVTPETACMRAENIRRGIDELRSFEGKEFYGEVTVSIGVALYPDDGTTIEVLLRKADQALYRAKQQGRNQVLLAADSIFAG
jgi:diguanylate cyclase (GGDEF)-like protein